MDTHGTEFGLEDTLEQLYRFNLESVSNYFVN